MDAARYSIQLTEEVKYVLEWAQATSTKNRKTFEPICSAVLSNQHKTAVKLVAKQIEKSALTSPASHILKLVKAMLAIHASKLQDALTVVLPIAKQAIPDADVLHLTGFILVTLRFAVPQAQTTLDAFLDKMINDHNSKQDISREVLKICIQTQDFKHIQQLMFKLSKRPNPAQHTKHIGLALSAMIMQILAALKSPSTLASTDSAILLSLLDRYIETSFPALAPDALPTSAEFWLRAKALELHILLAPITQQPLQEAKRDFLAFFDLPSSRTWTERDLGFEIWRRDSLLAHGSVENVKTLFGELFASLEKNDTNWHTITTLVHAACRVTSAGNVASQEDSPLEKLYTLLLETSTSSRGAERGFTLGLLFLLQQATNEGIAPPPTWPTMPELVIKYFDGFGTKDCWFDDVLPFVQVLDGAALDQIVAGLTTLSDLTEPALTKRINADRFKMYATFETKSYSVEQCIDVAKQYGEKYFAALPLGKGLPTTDLQPADDYAILGAEALVRAWHLSHNATYLLQAACLVEFCIGRSPYRYQARILLVRLYRLLGLPERALDTFFGLGLRTIQNDTLLHFVMERASSFALCFDMVDANAINHPLLQVARRASAWYITGGEREAIESAYRVWSTGVLPKIEEYQQVVETLQGSFARCALALEKSRLGSLVNSPRSDDLLRDVRTSRAQMTPTMRLCDKRDVSILPKSLWQLTELGPRPNHVWLDALTSTGSVQDAELDNNLTLQEAASYKILTPLATLLTDAKALGPYMERFRTYVDSVCQELTESKAVTFSWVPVHALHVAVYTLSRLSSFCKSLQDDPKTPQKTKLAKTFAQELTSAKSKLKATLAQVEQAQQAVEPTTPSNMTLNAFDELEMDLFLKRAVIDWRSTAASFSVAAKRLV